MRIVLLSLVLTACMTVEPETAAPSSEDACGLARVADLVGRTRNDSLIAEVGRLSGSRWVRWIWPGDVVTMDYGPGRLNVYLDGDDRISRFACG